MKTLIKILVAAALMVAVRPALAQKIDSLWTAPMNGVVWRMNITPDGTLVATTQEAGNGSSYLRLTGINPETGAVKWRYPSEVKSYNGNIKGIDFIPNTPFIMPANVPFTVIDPSDGKILVDAASENISNIEDSGFLLESGHAWVSGTTNGDRTISLFDLRTGKKVWTNAEFLKEKNKTTAKLNKFAAFAAPGLQTSAKGPIKIMGRPINHGKNSMIIGTSNGIFHVDIASGNIDWEAELPDINKGKAIKVEVDDGFLQLKPGRGQTFFVIKAAYMVAMNYSDGKPTWSKPVKTSGPIDQIIYDEAGLILCPGSANVKGIAATSYVKLVDEKTGEEKWGDGIKFNGAIKNYLYTDKGLAVAMVNSSSNKNSINFIDVAGGKFVLPKNLNVDGNIQYLELTLAGLLYKTDREINIVGLDTDKPLMSLPVQSKNERPILSVNTPDHVYFYSDDDKAVFDIDKQKGTSTVLSKSKVDFKGGEQPVYMELRDGGISLYSQQNATLFALSGEAKYNVYNPGVQTAAMVINKTLATADLMLSVANLAKAGDNIATLSSASVNVPASFTPAQKAAARNGFSQLQQAYAEVGTADFIMSLNQFKNVKSRLTASAQSRNEIYMMTKVDDRSVLLGINKDSGAPVSKVLLAKRDKDPLYELDNESGYLYYAPKGSNVMGWSNTANCIAGFRTPTK